MKPKKQWFLLGFAATTDSHLPTSLPPVYTQTNHFHRSNICSLNQLPWKGALQHLVSTDRTLSGSCTRTQLCLAFLSSTQSNAASLRPRTSVVLAMLPRPCIRPPPRLHSQQQPTTNNNNNQYSNSRVVTINIHLSLTLLLFGQCSCNVFALHLQHHLPTAVNVNTHYFPVKIPCIITNSNPLHPCVISIWEVSVHKSSSERTPLRVRLRSSVPLASRSWVWAKWKFSGW